MNLFDLGIVLAVAFLVAGLSLTINDRTGRVESRRAAAPSSERTIPNPSTRPQAQGQGQQVGTVYRTPDGRLIYVERPRGSTTTPPSTTTPQAPPTTTPQAPPTTTPQNPLTTPAPQPGAP